MIREIRIKNLALIDDVSLCFEPGFSVFTGETGAGKSILIGAIGLLLGERAQTEHIRSGCEEAEISGIFDIPASHGHIITLLRELDIPHEESSIIIRRHILKAGKNRVLVNQVPVTLASLKKIGDILIDLHGQHDHQLLLQDETARQIIDSLPAVTEAAHVYQSRYEAYRLAESSLAAFDRDAKELAQKKDFIEFQYREIADLSLKKDEESELDDELNLLSSTQSRAESINTILQLLNGDTAPGVESGLARIIKELRTLSKHEPKAEQWLSDVDNAAAVVSELSTFCASYQETIAEQSDPRRLEYINERSAKIQRLKKKHGVSFDELFARQVRLEADLSALENSKAERTELEKEMNRTFAACKEAGAVLSAARQNNARKFDKKISDMMSRLGFKEGKWKTDFEALENPGPYGQENIRFLVRTNPGEPFLPLAKTASGGEISRLMLAIKTILAHNDTTPVLIFDEIDTGIGGVLAKEVARCLYELSKSHQVLCISHLHQIASIADHHYTVYKKTAAQRTHTEAKKLSQEERVEEIARMLGGQSDISLSHAKSLLGEKTS